MKKSLSKFITLALAAALSFGAHAVGNVGDITSIQAVPVDGNWTTPKTVGESFYVLVRMLNEKWYEAADTDAPKTHEWVIERNAESILSGDWTTGAYQPALRLAIGAKKVNATLALVGPNGELNGLNRENDFYTDFYFVYTVQEGELGLPVRFVNAKDVIVDSDNADALKGGFYLVNVKTRGNPIGYYDLTNDIYHEDEGRTSLANFIYDVNVDPTSMRPYPGPDTMPRVNYDMVYAGQAEGKTIGISVKTIDFGPAEEEAKKQNAWRLVEQNGNTQNVEPQLVGQGPTTVYVWSDNESAVVPEGEVEPTGDGRTVVKVQLNADGTPTTFALKGTTTAAIGDTAWICLCSQPTPAKNWQGEVIPDSFISNRVEIVRSFTRLSITDEAGNQTPKIEATTNELACLAMKLTMSKPFEKPFEVNLNPEVVGAPGLDALTNKYVVVLAEKDQDPTVVTASITNLQIAANQTTVYFYVYPLGSCKELSDTAGGLRFKPTINKDLYPEAYEFFSEAEPIAATVKVTDQKPTGSVSSQTDAFEGDPVEVEIEVKDNWRDLTAYNTNGYTVVIRLDSDEVMRKENVAFAAEASKSFTFNAPVTKNARDEEKTMTVRVWDGTHGTGNNAAFTWTGPFTLRAQPTFRAYARLCYPGTSTAIDANHLFCEGDSAQLSFAMEDANGKPIGAPRDLYAMLVPLDAMSSNLVDAAVLTKKFEFASTATNSQQSVVITLLDGDALKVPQTVVNFRFDIYDAKTGDLIDVAAIKHVTVPQMTVTNAAPTIVGVHKGVDYGEYEAVMPKDGLYDGRIPSSVPVAFAVKLSDLGFIDATSATSRVKWEWTDGPAGDKWSNRELCTVASNGVGMLSITFNEPEVEQTISLYVQDRDQKAAATDANDFGETPAFTFRVKVAQMPHVVVNYSAGNTAGIFYETEDYSTKKALGVKLSEFPTAQNTYKDEEGKVIDPPIGKDNPLIVRLTLGGFDDTGVLHFKTNLYYFTGMTEQPVYFDKWTQNGGGMPSMTVVHAEVMNGNTREGYPVSRNQDGTPWCEYFAPVDPEIRLYDEAPVQIKLAKGSGYSGTFSANGTNTWTENQQVTLKWTVTDTAFDLTNGLFTVNWENIYDDRAESSVTLTNGWPITLSGGSPLKANASGEIKFTVPGESTAVTFTADDGEGGAVSTTFWINIVATKKIAVNTFGPANSTQTKYRTAAGLGRGHIYVDDSNGSYIARQFEQTWNFNEAKKQATLFGAGYPAVPGRSAFDDGKLGVDDDYPNGAALTPTGGKATKAPYYDYGNSEYDNYFYVWAQVGGEDAGGGVTYFNVQPTKKPSDVAKHVFTLDNEKAKDSETSYGTIETEAIFAQELYPSDNMGDINADGIPDLYVLFSWKGGMLGGIYGEDGSLSGNDLAKIDALNEDGDFIPATYVSKYGSFIPDLEGTWVTFGTPFKAVTEIRGYDKGLNDAPGQTGIKGVEPERVYVAEDGTWNEQECTISELEYVAFTNWCGRQETALDPTLKTNWAKWSPERPTDPTVADTDEDGFTDGYEYYFWYRAHVGFIDGDGTYRRMTGRRFVPTNPAIPEIIPADDIAATMDPRVACSEDDFNTRDSDNDGLVDGVEFELGTNPFDFDTDGDGLPDGYEVMVSETDPLLYATDLVTPDGELNTDHDFKAETFMPLSWVDLESTLVPGVTNRFWSVEDFAFTNVVSGASEEITNRQVLANGGLFRVWRYGSGNPEAPWALGGSNDVQSVTGAAWTVVADGVESVKLLHYQVLEKDGFDPRVGWNDPKPAKPGHIVTTTPFTHLDEFLVMAFYYYNGGVEAGDLVPTLGKGARTWERIWADNCTNPLSADTDMDGMPDGWELYIQAGRGRGPGCIYSPLYDFGKVIGGDRDPDQDGLDLVQEYAGIESVGRYSGTCETIQLTPDQERWQNKWWCTDPFNPDTDGDGLSDGAEFTFIWDDAKHKAAIDDEGCVEGGGLNPLSWDTDLDGLPDPFELEFIGDGAWVAEATAAPAPASTNDTTNVTAKVETASGKWNALGLNGTLNDARQDCDHDGLSNWQEYMTSSMRCWRYDDTVSPWNDGPFDPVANLYFSLCTNAFEQDAWVVNPKVYNNYYMFKDGYYHDLARNTPNRFTEKDSGGGYSLVNINGTAICPHKYICTSPILADTDHDGMDDYYELFHGLNPILGESGVRSNGMPCDIVFESYWLDLTPWSAEANYWIEGTGYKKLTRPETPFRNAGRAAENGAYDFFQFPWLAGLARADADGDNIRNQTESIMQGVQAASTYHHSDPTPLWMTDSSYGASLVSRYYYIAPGGASITVRWMGAYALNTMFSYEENEGFDSDHDFLGDFEETQGKTKTASDPQWHDSPLRRQAMWLNGTDAFLQTALPEFEANPLQAGVSTVGQNYLYFTVECWAKPDGETLDREQTLVERSVYTGPAGSADAKYLRKNFLIGIRNGRWYAKFDTDGVDEAQAVEITNGPEATTNWTHIAFTYGPDNGDQRDPAQPMSARLYVNGICGGTSKTTGAHPEHGISALALSKINTEAGYFMWSNPLLGPLVSFTVGASAETMNGIVFDMGYRAAGSYPETTLADYGRFYRGYIDEIRIWDGARTPKAILDDYTARTRYTDETALENRAQFHDKWSVGAVRSPSSPDDLPARLMHHWAFDHIAGAVEAADVNDVPAGFRTGEDVTDGMAIWARPAGWTNAWWRSVGVRSTVYGDTAWVPWINDTVGHLPRYDRTTLDSVYWSDDYAGYVSALESGLTQFYFPRKGEVPSRWVQMCCETAPYTQNTRRDLVASKGNLLSDYSFTMLDRQTAGFDLLPMGGAYPRRISAAEGGMWDDQGPADAWAETGTDADHNSLADWWERYARANYAKDLSPWAPFTWDTTVTYGEIQMPAWQAYLRDLARGLLPDGKVHPEFADTRDLDHDGMPDWWESLYGIDTGHASDAIADPDNDGLSNYQEYLVSERDGHYLIRPDLPRSLPGQTETDYFLPMPSGHGHDGEYLGEVYADHDFMEDLLEDDLGTDRTLYDAHSDNDEDGWSAWSELRYSTFKATRAARFVSHIVGDEEVKDFPIPVIHATLRYNGTKVLAGSNATIVVEAYAGNNLQKTPDASYRITPGATVDRTLYLGGYEDRVIHGTLTPGFLKAGIDLVSLQCAFIQPADMFSWMYADVAGMPVVGNYDQMYEAYRQYGDQMKVATQPFEWINVVTPDFSQNALQLTYDEATQTGDFLFINERVGKIDYRSGDFDLDISKLRDWFMATGVSFRQMFFRLKYAVSVPALQNRALSVTLANPDSGNLTEGTTAFVAYMDFDGDGFTPDKDPIGFAKGVEIGWDGVPELVIEMTDASQAGARFAYGEDVENLRIIRTAFNGQEYVGGRLDSPVRRRIVFSRSAKDIERRSVYEGDFVSDTKFGLDWAGLRNDIEGAGLSPKDVSEVTYLVVHDTLSVDHIDASNILQTITVSYSAEQIAPTPTSPSASVQPYVTTARPTFKWKGTEDNTVFLFQLADAAGNLVYTNAMTVLPARDATANYVWQAPVFIGTNVCGDAWALDNHADYKWRVAMFNQKYSRVSDAKWSDWSAFRTELAEANDFSSRCGSAKVSVRYFGPATNELDKVIVQLFQNADFTGVPAAQTRLFETNGVVGSLTNAQTVVFHGLMADDYYACAFIDRNGDGIRQNYETWGYSANVGKGLAAIWTPTAATVDPASTKVPAVEVYMEDTDVNQNRRVDCLDDESVLKTATAASSTVTGDDDTDGDGLSATEEMNDAYTDTQKWDTDGDGLPDGWESRFADLDPLSADAGTVLAGDVMAFATEGGKRVKNAAGESFVLIPPSNVTYRAGDYVPADHLWAYYDYKTVIGEGTNAVTVTYCGVGTNLVGTAATFLIDTIEPVTLAYVHAQVYDRFGYSLKTAIPQDGAVNTKPFTALDKYMVVRYLEAMGLADEKAMNFKKDKTDDPYARWSAWTLKPLNADADRDGMADGWELYVMFGTNGCGFVSDGVGGKKPVTQLSEVAISPWNFSDRNVDIEGDGLTNVEEYSDGNDPSDPWNMYSVYESLVASGVIPADTEKFDDKVRRFGIGEGDLDGDWDLDIVSNGQEMWSYYIDYASKSSLLADISPTNAWSDGSTPDYFRTFAEKPGVTNYLGAYWNGGEFIEPDMRERLGLGASPFAGTRDAQMSGWSFWSIARNIKFADVNVEDMTEAEKLDLVLKYMAIEHPGRFEGTSLDDVIDFLVKRMSDRSVVYLDNLEKIDDVLAYIGGLEGTKEERVANGLLIVDAKVKEASVNGELMLPEPKVGLTLRYAGSAPQAIVVEAYQVSSAYPEYGEQLTAKWTANATFDAGISKPVLTLTDGSLKQGPARFVAYIDVDGDGKFSSGDVSGSATAEVGYLGCTLTIALGEANPALPPIRLSDGSNSVSTIAFVRSEINGKPLYNNAKGVFIVKFMNNAAREALYPDEYDDGSYIGIDKKLSLLDNLDEIEEVTYEVLRLKADQIAGLSVTDLNNYTVVGTNGVTNVVSQALNETVKFRYSRSRDVAKSIVCAGSTADDYTLSFTVPTDTMNTKFWLSVQTNGAEKATLVGGDKGFILNSIRDGVVVLDKAWFEANRVTIPTGETKFGVVLGNDKFGKPNAADISAAPMATVVINEGASFEGALAVKVAHPLADLDAKLTVAAYENADLVNPVFVTNNCTAGEAVELKGLKPGASYYVAAWYAKDADDGRGSAARRMPYDTWGYLTMLGEVSNGFDAKAVKAEVAPSVTNTVWLQDTDFNANGKVDREEDFKEVYGDYERSVDPAYGFDIAGVEDAEIFSDAMENDVFAYAEVPFYCVVTEIEGTEIWFAVTDLASETVSDKVTPGIPVGTSLSDLTSLATTYYYDFGKSNAKRLALGTNVTWTGSEKVTKAVEGKMLVLVHAQVYDYFGFNPNTANGRISSSEWVNTRPFSSVDKAYVTNYLANVVGLADAWKYALPTDYPDADKVAGGRGDGILDGWELYVMFGTNEVKSAETMAHSPWNYEDRTFDADGDGLDQLHEYDGGAESTDPWNAYSMYESLAKEGLLLPGTVKFDDAAAKKFGLSAATIGEDWDLDLISNIDELAAYYRDPTALADLSVTNAWSNGITNDYFRLCGSKYLGELFNGAEFIEPNVRGVMGLGTEARAGTRAYNETGWDAWSTARYSIRNADLAVNIEGVVSDELMLLIRYWNVIRPGEFSGTTVSNAVEYFHTTWASVKRILDENGDVVVEGTGSISGPGVVLVEADAAQTTSQIITFFGGQKKMEEVIARNKKDITADEIVTPEPVMNFALKYAGNETIQVVFEAYQTSATYPEYGEQLTAQWTSPVEFNSGVGRVNELRTPGLGFLKQGPARFVAYIDVDGDGRLSAGDVSGTTAAEVGYLGGTIEIRLGEANPALPIVELTTDGSNVVNTVAFVRTKINGQYLTNPRGVTLRRYDNNVNRTALYPADYVSDLDDYIGVDKYLASEETELDPSGDDLDNVEEVTYEIVKLSRSAVAEGENGPLISNTNLNHYAYNEEIVDSESGDVISNILHTVDQQVNEEFTVRYSITRDVAMEVKGEAASLENDAIVSFAVPTDRAVMKFWLEIDGKNCNKRGFLLPNVVPGAKANTGRVILDTRWFVENGLAKVLSEGVHRVRIGLGNDKFPDAPASDEWSAEAKFSVNAAAAFDGAIDVMVLHPTADLESKVTIALYETEDLANPVAVTNGCAAGETIEIEGLRTGASYYVAAWYVKDEKDGRDSKSVRMPYDTWGYLTQLGEAANGFDAKAVKAVDPANRMVDVPMVTNLVFLQDTDWNGNNVVDREEEICSILGTTAPKAPEWEDLDCDGIVNPDDPDPVFDNSGDWIEGDVMAYQVKRVLCVQVGTVDVETNWTWYAVMDPKAEPFRLSGDTVVIPRGTKASDLTTLRSLYLYGRKKSSPYGLGTNVTLTAGEVYHYDWMNVVLVHNQVYQENGFNPNTANALIPEADWVNTKKFTKLDKYIVTNYLAAVGALAPDAVMTNWVLRASDKKHKYNIDFDFDGIPDGFELYTMFGHKAVKVLTKTADEDVLNAWVYDDRAFDPDGDQLANVYEYDGGHFPTDPWSVDTDRDGVTDNYAFAYHLKGGEAPMDFDGDGLSNYAEYLISEVFRYAKLDPESAKTDGFCVDYFQKMGDLYLGEIFTDHDQVDDTWESGYPTAANRDLYDPDRDDDNDGWSNYAEFRAGTDPSELATFGVSGSDNVTYTKNEYPVPIIEAKVVYNGNGVNLGAIVFKAWSDAADPDMTSAPDAIWTIGNGEAKDSEADKPAAGSTETSSSIETHEKYVGKRPNGVQRYHLTGGSIVPGRVVVSVLDPNFTRGGKNGTATAKDARWYVAVTDREGELFLDIRGEKVGTVDYKTGVMTLDCSKLTGVATGVPNSTDGDGAKLIADKATASTTGGSSYDEVSLDGAYLRIGWSAVNVGFTPNGTYYLSDADQVGDGAVSHGHVREGLNTFFCFADANGDGAYTAGEPFGVVRGVEVGWQGAKFEVELGETSPIADRINLTDNSDDRKASIYGTLDVLLNDRTIGRQLTNEAERAALVASLSNRVQQTAIAAGMSSQIRVVRYGIDNMFCYLAGVGENGVDQRVVMGKEFDTSSRDFINEADFLGADAFDIDWGTMTGEIVDATGKPIAGVAEAGLGVTNMTYLVVVGDGKKDFRGSEDTNTVFVAGVITRRFDAEWAAPRCEGVIGGGSVAPAGVVYTARPTFVWSMPNESKWAKRFGSSYTAFELRIFDRDTDALVYSSGVVRAPVQDAAGRFVWTAPISVGDQTPQGKIFKNAANYYWDVAMFNAKFQSRENPARSESRNFSTLVNVQQPQNDAGAFSVGVTVKYTGPEKVLEKCAAATDVQGKVRVQAFTTADFSGVPAAQTFVANKAALTDVADVLTNACLKGLAAGTYYVRAYIDMNGNFAKDAFESWGYAKDPVTVGTDVIQTPAVSLYIEDADTNGNWYPDAWEYVEYGKWAKTWDAVNQYAPDIEQGGKIVLSTAVYDGMVNGTAGISTALGGAKITVFQDAEFSKLILKSYLGDDVTYTTFDAIRKAVEKKVVDKTLKITAITLDTAKSQVVLAMDAETDYANLVAGNIATRLYDLDAMGIDSTCTVTVEVYKKATLAQEKWQLVDTVKNVKIGRGAVEVKVDVKDNGGDIDPTSGFYMIKVVQ